MTGLVSRIKKIVSENKYVQMARLALAPCTETPLDYVRRRSTWRRAWTQPFLAGSAYGSVNVLFAHYFLQRFPLSATKVPSIIDAFAVNHFEFLLGLTATAFAAVFVYVTALARWGFHACAIAFARRFIPQVIRPPLRFFVVVNSGYALWFTAVGLAIVAVLQLASGTVPTIYIRNQEQAHPLFFLAAAVAVWGITRIAQKKQHEGLLAMYAGSRSLLLLLDAATVMILLTLVVLLTHVRLH